MEKTIWLSWRALLEALSRPYFYIEVSLIGIVLAVAWLLIILLHTRLSRFLENHPPKIGADFFLKPIPLLAPLLAFLGLSISKPFSEKYAEGSEWTSATMELLLAYTMARAALIFIKSRAVAYFIAFILLAYAGLNASGFLEPTKDVLENVAFSIGKVKLSMLSVVHGFIILVLVFWVAGLISSTLESYLRKSASLNYNTRELIIKFVRIILYSTAFLMTISSMGVDLTALAVFGGALGVGVGLGLQKITANFVSGVTLLLEKSIKIGDLVEVNSVTGWVRQLNIRYALIETPDGRELLVPNEQLVSTQVTNWTHSNENARIEFPFGVAYDSDVEKVKKLVIAAMLAHPRCLKTPSPTCFMRQFGDSALVFNATFWVEDIREGRQSAQSDVMCALLKSFVENGIEIPYPHQVAISKEG